MLPVNPPTPTPSNNISRVCRDSLNPEGQEIWFDAIDYVEMEFTWFGGAEAFAPHEEQQADPSSSAGEAAESRVPFTEDCRRGVQQFVRTLGECGESIMLSACLSKILPGTPASLVVAANSLYTAVTERRNIDTAALHALGLASWYLPENMNVVSRLASFIRDTVTGWTDETFLHQSLGNEDNHTSIHLFTALAITAIVAGRWMKDEGAPQRGVLKIPAFMANIFIRASHYWTALGNMAGSLPSGAAIPENTGSSQRAPAFEVDTQVEMTRDVCDAAVSCSSSIPRLTAFSSNSTAHPEDYTRATVQNRPGPASVKNSHLSVPEQAHYLAVEKLRLESGLSELLFCTNLKTETRQQTNEKVITNTHFNTKCDATVYPEPLTKEADRILIHTDIPETQVSSAATSRSVGEPLLPIVMTTAAIPVATSYIQALKSRTVIAAGAAMGLFGLTVGGKALWNSLRSPAVRDADRAVPDTQSKSVKRESIIQDCTCMSKRELGSNDEPYNDYFISNMPCQKEFEIVTNAPPHNSAGALNEIFHTMNAIIGENNLRQYDSIEQLKNARNDHHGKILIRRIENALSEGGRRINNAYQKFINPAEKDDILFYLSAVLKTDNKIAIDEAYERLRRTAFRTSMLIKNNIHLTAFFERRDKNIPLPSTKDKSPMVLVNKKNPAIIKINLEEAENKIAELLVLQSSAGYNPELMEAFMRQMIMLGGNTQDLVTLPACQNEQGLSLGSYQRALLYFAIKNQPAQALAGNWSVYPNDNAVWEILNKAHNVILTDKMRDEAKNKLQNRHDEYYQRKTGKSDPSPHEQQEIVNTIAWIYTGSVIDFEAMKFFNDPVYRADIMTANTDSATIYLRDIGEDGIQAARTENSLSDNTLFIDFKQKAQALRNSFGAPYKVARNIAIDKVYQRTGQSLDPDKIFLHQFKQSQTVKDSSSFTGYTHNGQPIHSETLTQAFMDNFKVFRRRQFSSFINLLNRGAALAAGNGYLPDHLDNPELTAPFFTGPDKLTGLYQVDASATHFGAENEVKYLPSVLKNDIYDANIMKQIEEQQQEFWSENSEAWRAIAKGQFIEEARLAYINNILSQQAYETAIKGGAANIILYDPVTMRELSESAAADPSVEVSFLNVRTLSSSFSPMEPEPYESFYSTNILCFTGKDGHEVLYLPGDVNAFREFKDAKELETWFEQQIKKEDTRNAFLQHVSLADRQNEVEASLTDLANGKIFEDVWGGDLKPTFVKNSIKTKYYTEDTFSALTQLTKERTEQDADTLISSNGEIVLESVQQILQVVSMVAVPLLPMLGPVGIALDIGLTVAQLGTDIGIMYTADRQDDYNAVLIDVGMSLLFLGLNGIRAISANKNAVQSATPFRQTLLKTDVTTLQKQSGFLQRIQLIRENGLSGRGAIMFGKNRLQRVKKPIGEDLNFRWIDDEIGETEKNLQKLLFSRGESAAKLREFRQNPSGFCYEAMVESYNSLKNQGEQPKVIGLLIYKTPWDDAPSNHFAVFLNKDASDFVVDPTVRQFFPVLPEEATISTLGEWRALMINKVGVGKDSVIIMNTFDTPLLAKLNVAELHAAKGKFYQSSLIKKDNFNILKHSDRLENYIIKEISIANSELKRLPHNSVEYSYVRKDLERLRVLKSHLSIHSPNEIKVTHKIEKKFKKQISKYSVPTTDISALRSIGDSRDIISTVAGKHYIKIQKNAWINIEQSADSSFWIAFQGQKKTVDEF